MKRYLIIFYVFVWSITSYAKSSPPPPPFEGPGPPPPTEVSIDKYVCILIFCSILIGFYKLRDGDKDYD